MASLKKLSALQIHEHPLFLKHADIWQQVEAFARTRICQRDEVILHHGDPAETLWLVFQGWVKLIRQTPDGKESIVGLCAEGDVFGEAALFPHACYPYHAEAIGGEVVLLGVPSEVIRGLIKQNTQLSETIISLLNERMMQAQLKLEQMNTLSAAQRLGCFLLRLCQTQSQGKKIIRIPVEKHVLAAYLGMKPETLSRSQQQLKLQGVHITGHDFTLANIESLRHFVCNSCSESGNCDAEES
jgi:CRP-like cAMP-binding protein